jgi:4-hydroxy-tetrahydrodipicolinate synthase
MSSTVTNNFSGCFVALITPMFENGDVDYSGLKKLVDWHIESGTDGLVILGTTAETATLTEQEQAQVLDVAIAQNQGRLPLIVGNGLNCTRSTVEKTKKLDSLAIDGYLTVTPYYNKPSQKGMVEHFKAVAAATRKPVILYNVPSRTGVDLSNQSVFELMEIDNIVGIKDATGDLSRVSAMKQQDPSFLLFGGDDLTSQHYLSLGGDGVISVTANVEPELMQKMVKESIADNQKDAELYDEKLCLLHRDLFIEPNPVPTKWALKEKGLISSDMVRLPLVTMEPNNHKTIKLALQHVN